MTVHAERTKKCNQVSCSTLNALLRAKTLIVCHVKPVLQIRDFCSNPDPTKRSRSGSLKKKKICFKYFYLIFLLPGTDIFKNVHFSKNVYLVNKIYFSFYYIYGVGTGSGRFDLIMI